MGAKSRITAYALCLMALLALCLPARADYHYASHDGSNEYPYTSWETAAELIQDAVDAASPHDTVYVGAGDYHERVDVYTDSLAMVGMGMDSTRVWWDIFGETIIRSYTDSYISDLFIDHTASYFTSLYGGIFAYIIVERCRFEGGGVLAGNIGTIIRNCIFNGLKSGAHTGLYCDYLEVSNCIFYTTNTAPIISEADTNIITNNIIRAHDNSGRGIELSSGQIYNRIANNLIELWGPSVGVVMFAIEGNEPFFANNTIDTLYRWQDEAQDGIRLYRGNMTTNIANNSVTGGEIAGIHIYHENLILNANYNNIWGTDQYFLLDDSSSIVDTTFGILHEYPMFDKDNDYRLQAFSPLIDAGDPNILDVDDSRSDIGCYGGPGGSSYEYLDLPPLIPVDLSAEVDFEDLVIYLNWHYNEEADFNRYQLHRDTISGFEPSVFNMIAEPDTSFYADYDWSPEHNYYYKISAVDNQDNMSDYSEELAVILVSIWGQPGVEIPDFTSITSNYPNPFNSTTTIIYHVANIGPVPAEIKIEIYDILGRKVRTLINERKEVGEHKITWDGKDDDWIDLPSGVYFARIVQWGQRHLSSKRKLVFVK